MLEIDKTAYTFTGQGSQRVGMWDGLRGFKAAVEIFQTADEIVGFPLSRLCSEGPLEELTRTSNAQPAIVTHSLAALASLYESHPQLQETPPVFYLGHSAGEYGALAAAGVIAPETAISLVRTRGLLIEEMSTEGGMLAIHRFRDAEQVLDLCLKTGTEAANFNSPGQIVISGGVKEIEEARILATDAGMKVILLQTSHAFHSSLMRSVTERFKEVLAKVQFRDPIIPIIPNVKAKPSLSGDEIKEAIAEQIAQPVRWQESVEWVLEQGVNTFLEFGPEGVLTGLLKRIDPKARGICIKDYESAVKYPHARAS